MASEMSGVGAPAGTLTTRTAVGEKKCSSTRVLSAVMAENGAAQATTAEVTKVRISDVVRFMNLG